MENNTELDQSAPGNNNPEDLTPGGGDDDSQDSSDQSDAEQEGDEASIDPDEDGIDGAARDRSNVTDEAKIATTDHSDVELPEATQRQLADLDRVELMSARSRSLEEEREWQRQRHLEDIVRRQDEAKQWRESHIKHREELMARWEKIDFLRRAHMKFYRAKCAHQQRLLNELQQQQNRNTSET